MSTTEIKIILLRQGLEIKELAQEFDCRRQELSMCIRQVRIYPELRKKLAKKLKMTVEQLFGPEEESGKLLSFLQPNGSSKQLQKRSQR